MSSIDFEFQRSCFMSQRWATCFVNGYPVNLLHCFMDQRWIRLSWLMPDNKSVATFRGHFGKCSAFEYSFVDCISNFVEKTRELENLLLPVLATHNSHKLFGKHLPQLKLTGIMGRERDWTWCRILWQKIENCWHQISIWYWTIITSLCISTLITGVSYSPSPWTQVILPCSLFSNSKLTW